MISKKGLRERPTYEKLMQTLRNDFPLQLPNRDAYFLRNSLQMTQFDGIGMLDNLEEQSNRIAENQLRQAALQQAASSSGVDVKLIQTDPAITADKYTGMKQPKSKESQTGQPRTSDGESSTDPRPPDEPKSNKSDAGTQFSPTFFDIAGEPAPMAEDEQQIDKQIEDRQSAGRRKWAKAKDLVKQHLEKTKSTTAKIVDKAEADKEKRQRKMDTDPANQDMTKPDPGASSSSRGVSPPKKAETRKEQTPQPSPIKKKVKTEDVKVEVKDEPETKVEPKGKPGRPRSVKGEVKKEEETKGKPTRAKSLPPPESAAPKPRGRPRKDAAQSSGSASADVSLDTSNLSSSLDRGWWEHNTSAKEIRNQLALRGVNRDLWLFKTKNENLTLLLKTIRAQNP